MVFSTPRSANMFELYRKSWESAIGAEEPQRCAGRAMELLCYNSAKLQRLMSMHFVSYGARVKRVATLLAAPLALVFLVGCGGNANPNPVTTSKLKHRAFVSNTHSGALQVIDTQNDTTAFNQQTFNSAGQFVPGAPVEIPVSLSVTFEVESPDNTVTAVYDPTTNAMFFVTNSTEMSAGDIPLTSPTGMALFSSDSAKMYTPEPNLPVMNGRAGGVEVLTRSSISVTATYDVPSARYIALSPSGQYLLVFASNSDSVFVVDTTQSTPTPVEIPGFARPINAFFSSDNNTAYVLNCGPECGSSGPAAVAAFNIPDALSNPQTAMISTVPVGGASVGLLSGTTLYVAGSPVPPGTTSTYDAVNVSNMTRITANSVTIGDGFHTTMALAPNNKLYIGASNCLNTMQTGGCLSVVDVGTNTADAMLPPRGAITSLLSVPGRNVIYAVEGGVLHIYDTSTDQLQATQLAFTGALYGIVQVDPN